MRKLWLFLAMLPAMGFGDQIFFGSPSYITVNTNLAACPASPYTSACSQSALAQNIKRGYLLLQNTGTANAYFSFGGPQSASDSFILVSGEGAYEPVVPPSSQLFLIVPTGAGIVVMEGNQ